MGDSLIAAALGPLRAYIGFAGPTAYLTYFRMGKRSVLTVLRRK